MKKNAVLLVCSLFLASSFLSAQISGADSLQLFCDISPTAQYVIRNASSLKNSDIEMVEYNKDKDVDSLSFIFEVAIMYEWGHCDLLLNAMANNLWSFISLQRNAEPGLLSTDHLNFFLTRNEKNQANLVLVMWDSIRKKWRIMSMSPFKVKTLLKGARMFSVKSN